MSKIIREDIDQLNSILTVVVERPDYEPQFKSELKKYRDQAHLKGFRKGKVPMSAVRKMFGKGILAELVNDLFQKKLFEYIRDEDLNVVGQPLLADGQELLDFDAKQLGDFELKFDVGAVENFEIIGLEDDKYTLYKVEVPDETIQKDLENAQLRMGQFEEVEGPIGETDSVKLEVREMEGEALKEGGQEGSFTIMMDRVTHEETKAALLTKKNGASLKVNILELEDLGSNGVQPENKMDFVKKYYLGIDAEEEVTISPFFEATIIEVKRRVPAEMNEAFFQQMFPEGGVNSEEEAKDQIRKDYQKHYDNQAASLLYKEISDELVELNEIALPDDFLKRWLKTTNEKLTDTSIEHEYPKYAKQLKWSLIREKLIKNHELKVEHEAVLAKAKSEILRHVPYYQTDENYLNDIAHKFLEDPKQYNKYYDEAMSDQLLDAILEKLKFKEEVLSVEDFQSKLQAAVEESKSNAPDFAKEEE